MLQPANIGNKCRAKPLWGNTCEIFMVEDTKNVDEVEPFKGKEENKIKIKNKKKGTKILKLKGSRYQVRKKKQSRGQMCGVCTYVIFLITKTS